jgi:hypothetical protein
MRVKNYHKALDCTAPATVTDNWDCTVLIPDPLPSTGVPKKDRYNHTQKETLMKFKKTKGFFGNIRQNHQQIPRPSLDL